jgi:SAM-dependent methyltransferase
MHRKTHWEEVYATKASDEVSWFQAEPTLSLALLQEVGSGASSTVIDVGGGDSRFVDAVIAEGLGHVTVLDISRAALTRAQTRLGTRADDVTWLEADITQVALPANAFDVWHDRAVFHFLTEPLDLARYAAAAATAVRSGGALLIFTFAPDGPTRCSGLATVRYAPEEIAEELGDSFEFVRGFAMIHHTPSAREQRFSVAVLRRR